MKVDRIEIPIICRWRFPWLVELAPFAAYLGLIGQRLMVAWLKAVLSLACLEMRIGDGTWQRVEVDLDLVFEDDDDDSDGGTPVPAFAGVRA